MNVPIRASMEKMKNTFFCLVVYMIFLTVESSIDGNESFSEGTITSTERTNERQEIYYPPSNVKIQYLADNGDLREGSGHITISCNADCNPICDGYRIYHNDMIKSESKENTITKDRKNNGQYYCAASNSLTPKFVNSFPVNIDIQYPPSNVKIQYWADNGDLKEGSGYITIRCNADCNPICDGYRIYHNDIIISESKETRITKNRTNAGQYYCAASNSLTPRFVNSFAVNIDIQYPPTNVSIQYWGDRGDLREGSGYIAIRCNADCNPNCNRYRIYHNDIIISESKETTITKDRTNAGQYYCAASNSLTPRFVNSFAVKIDIQYPPESVTITPENDTFYTQRNGKPLHDITCEADCLPECTYWWYRERYTYNSHTIGNSLFPMKSYFYRSSYRFRCLASNFISSVYSRWITVEVKDGPENVTIIPSSSEKENDSFQLTCSAICYHGCQYYIWYYKGARKHQGTGKTLTFDSLTREDSGDYQCGVTDYFGTAYSTYKINVLYGPKNVEIAYISWYGHFIEGNDIISITCKADCNPRCAYLFYQNGTSLNKTYTRELVHRNMSGRYTCSARNDIMITDMHSSNFIDIRIKYKPTITSFVNQTTITAPTLMNLAFSVDSFPSSNVTIFHEINPVTFVPNVTGRLSFNVSVESCLDQGEYRIEAVNDAGSDRFTVRADVKCSPIIVRHTNLSQIESQVRDSFNYTVKFMANPDAEVSWTFIEWNKNEPKKLEKPQIQNLRESTIVEINRLNFSFFGIYKLELKNDFGTITQEFHIRGPPQRPTDLSVYCPGSAIISWRPGSDGGSNQIFTIEYSNNSSHWQILRAQSAVPINNNLKSAQVNEILPNTMYSFRIRAENAYGFAESDTAVNCTRQSKPTISFSKNQTTITAPDLLNLAFSVDSFPSSNVTIFHESNRLTFLPNVTGHLSFNVSVESCLDQGDYRIEAVNDAGLDRLTVRADVECPPIAVRYSDVSQREFRVGDVLRLRVVFMANPTADVSWSFVPWNKNTSMEVQRHQIQNHNESTKIILILSDTDKFGKYRLELKNKFGTMRKEFNIQGPTQAATKAKVRTTSSSPKKPDSEGGLSLSTTSRKGKASAISEVEMNTFLLQQDKLQEEVHKLRVESDVLRLKKNYYIVKLQLFLREHPGVIDEVFGED